MNGRNQVIEETDVPVTGWDDMEPGGRPTCGWSDSVCLDAPDHHITWRGEEGHTAELFCERHMVLTLAHLVEVHLQTCGGSFDDHVVEYG